MTAPTITYGHGFINDTWANYTDDYTLTDGGGTVTAGPNSSRDLSLNITAYTGTANIVNDTDIDISTVTYPKALIRYRTIPTGTYKASIVAEFSDASTQTLVTDTAVTDWTLANVTLTTAKTLDHLYIYGKNDEGEVQVDFILVCKGQFTFPQYTKLSWSMRNRYNNTEVPSRLGRRKSWTGADETVIVIDGDIDDGRDGWKRPVGTTSKTDVLAAQVLNEIHHNASTEIWQYFTSDRANLKVVMENLDITEDPEQPFLASFNTVLSEYSDSNLTKYTLTQRLGL
jgi:hypothetical protein